MSLSVFTKLTGAVLVRDLMISAYKPVESHITVEEAANSHFNVAYIGNMRLQEDVPCRVTNSCGQVVGWVRPNQVHEALYDEVKKHGWAENENWTYASGNEPRIHVRDIMHTIEPSQLVSADTTLFCAVHIFASGNRDWFWVLDGPDICGTLHASCLHRPLFAACLLAMVLQLEQSALDLISLDISDANRHWSYLSDNRKQKALDQYKRVYEHDYKNPEKLGDPDAPSDHPPLDMTLMIDKCTILRKGLLLPNRTPDEIQKFFVLAEQVRNDCAHGHIHSLSSHEILGFAQDCHRYIKELDEAAEAKREDLMYPDEEPHDPLGA
jgi:hypothetical protein